MWSCRCRCGTEVIVSSGSLLRGATRSCKCLGGELSGQRAKKRLTTHGMTYTRTFTIWQGVIKRCENPKFDKYAYYGGRGIKVCARWRHSFDAFFADMGEAPPRLTLERNNSDGDYEPTNCRWASRKEQSNNQRSNVVFIIDGKRMTLTQIAERVGIKPATMKRRIKLGWCIERAMTTPVAKPPDAPPLS